MRRNIKLLLSLLAVGLFGLFIGPIVSAQYGNDPYGSCTYGQSCPAAPVSPGPEDSENPPPNDATSDPTMPVSPNPTDTGDPPTIEVGSPTNQNTRPNPADKDPTSPLAPPVRFIKELPPAVKVLLPYFLWILLIILAIILLVQAYLDRRKAIALARAIDTLRKKIFEQTNFLRLVSHHLKTPLTILKGVGELLGTAQPPETAVMKYLNPAIASLTDAAERAPGINDDNIPVIEKSAQPVPTNMVGIFSKWYCIAPISLAGVGAILFTYLLLQANEIKPVHNVLYQIAVGIMASLILANAIRFKKLGGERRKIVENVHRIVKNLEEERQQIINQLVVVLGSIMKQLLQAQKLVLNEKYRGFLSKGVEELNALHVRTHTYVSPLSDIKTLCVMRDVIESAVSPYRLEIGRRNITLDIDSNIKEPISIFEEDMKFILGCLISNALLYNHDGGSIEISSQVKHNQLAIKVKDTGMGMNSDALSSIFEPFYKAEDVLQYTHGGMGLSLYACKQIIDREGGTITLNSETNQGTEVIVEVPIASS